jgi:hyperosmotically inducible protein
MAAPSTTQSSRERTTADSIADGVITAKIKSGLMADPRTNGYSIDVATHGANVSLGGFVEFAIVRQQVLQIAADVPGVQHIEDFLDVRIISESLQRM